MLASVDKCTDTPFRKNLTMMLVAKTVRGWKEPRKEGHDGDPGMAVTMTTRWVTELPKYSMLTPAKFIDILKTQYFLVGVTERLNEFLVLLAIVNGWKLEHVYYRKW
jgi:hypothetical protein